jgi:hypothetical protein
MKLAKTYPIRLVCRLRGVPRSSLYYAARPAPFDEAMLKTALLDKLLAEADVSDVGHPNLIRPRNLQVGDEVGIAREGMVAVGGARRARGLGAVNAQLVHPAAHPFGVHRPIEAPHHRGEAAIAVGGPLAGQIVLNRDQAQSLAMVLNSWGFETAIAYDGLSGLHTAIQDQRTPSRWTLGCGSRTQCVR